VARLWLPIEEESPQASSSPASSVRVLVVDDDPQVREGLVGVLQSLGMEVEAAASGQEALGLLARQRPVDLVLLDLLMPGLSGFEVLAQLRQKNPRLPVLLSSGYAPDGRVQEALQQPFTWYLQKPYTLAQLQEALQQALGERPQKP
jgi:CheY-like chemotaxis protein